MNSFKDFFGGIEDEDDEGPVLGMGEGRTTGFGTWYWISYSVLGLILGTGLILLLLLSGARSRGLLERRLRLKSKLCEGGKDCRAKGPGSDSSHSKVTNW